MLKERGGKKSASFPRVFQWYISIWIEIFMLKKWKQVFKWKTMIKSFLPASLFLSLQMQRLIFLFKLLQLWENYNDKKWKREGRKSKEIKGVEEEA